MTNFITVLINILVLIGSFSALDRVSYENKTIVAFLIIIYATVSFGIQILQQHALVLSRLILGLGQSLSIKTLKDVKEDINNALEILDSSEKKGKIAAWSGYITNTLLYLVAGLTILTG